MKLRTLTVAVLLLALTGCAASPAARAYQFRTAYVAALSGIDAAVPSMTPAQARAVQQLLPVGDAAEKVMVANPSGGAAFDAALNAGQTVIDQIVTLKLAALKAKAK